MSHEKQWFQGQTSDDAKYERATLRQIVVAVYGAIGALCLAFLLLVSATWPTKAIAEELIPVHVLDKDGVEISLMAAPCVDPVSLRLVRAEHHARLKALQSVWPERDGSRKAYIGCWMELSPEESGQEGGAFLVVFEDNEHGVVPKSEFKKVRGQSDI